jgi:hypothetical protein
MKFKNMGSIALYCFLMGSIELELLNLLFPTFLGFNMFAVFVTQIVVFLPLSTNHKL